MTLLAELEEFVTEHQPDGTLTATNGELTPNGYRLEVAGPCGVTFERWITPREAAGDLVMLARLNRPMLATPSTGACWAAT